MKPFVFLSIFSALLASCGTSSVISEDSVSVSAPVSVKWVNDDGTILQTERCNKNNINSAKYLGSTPKKARNEQFTFYFDKWSEPVEQANGDIVYTATYREVINKYTITWKNSNGVVLEIDNDVPYGTTPTYDGVTPTREKDAQYTYSFNDWNPSIHSVTGNETYIASYNTALNYYYCYLDANTGECETDSLYIGYGQDYSLPTPTKLGYTFLGWYDGSTKVLQESKWNYSSDKNLIAKWEATKYTIYYVLNGGTNNSLNPKSYTIESDTILLSDPTRDGYTFLGWFDTKGNEVTSIPKGSTGFITLNARWNEGNIYTVTLISNVATILETTLEVQYDHAYSLPVLDVPGYTFNGWFEDSTQINNTGTWKYASNKTFVASWTIIDYSINYTLNGGTNNSNNPSSYTVDDTITFSAPSKTGYTFLGWYVGENVTTGIPKGSTGTVNVEARWSADLHSLSVTSEDTSKGTVAITSGSGYSDESITVVATPNEDCVFKGWYHESTKVSDGATYTFTMPINDYSLVAHFFTNAEEEEEVRAIKYGTRPILSEDGKTLTYGLYPQKNVNDSTLVSALNALTTPESNGWYLYNNDYYAKVSATPDMTSYKFDNGTTIVSGTTYWFKCEPITWNILKNNDGEYYILSSVLLDVHCYYDNSDSTGNRTIDGKTIYDNNYEYSDIRTWLNNDFYNSAFALDNSYIQITTVDNSGGNSSNPYACNNTQDKVFLLSYQDYINSSYGFSTSTGSTKTRYCRTTDWSRARGAEYSLSSGSHQYGVYWTRSPLSGYYSGSMWRVYYDGGLRHCYYSNSMMGVRPGLSIKIA